MNLKYTHRVNLLVWCFDRFTGNSFAIAVAIHTQCVPWLVKVIVCIWLEDMKKLNS